MRAVGLSAPKHAPASRACMTLPPFAVACAPIDLAMRATETARCLHAARGRQSGVAITPALPAHTL